MTTPNDDEAPTRGSAARRPLVVYLDQNKWIDLARAVTRVGGGVRRACSLHPSAIANRPAIRVAASLTG